MVCCKGERVRFGVIVCSRCKRARGITLDKKSTKCNYCGARDEVKGLRVYYETGNPRKLAIAVRQVNKQLRERSSRDENKTFP